MFVNDDDHKSPSCQIENESSRVGPRRMAKVASRRQQPYATAAVEQRRKKSTMAEKKENEKDSSLLTDPDDVNGGISGDMVAVNMKNTPQVTINESLWQQFASFTTEMIVTSGGQSMSPVPCFRITGLDPMVVYSVQLGFVQCDEYKYSYNANSCEWMRDTKVIPVTQMPYTHSLSPNSGAFWMSEEINFAMMKLSSCKSIDPNVYTVDLLCKYYPCISISKYHAVSVPSSTVVFTKTFPVAEFITTEAYHDARMDRLNDEKHHSHLQQNYKEINDIGIQDMPENEDVSIRSMSEEELIKLGILVNGHISFDSIRKQIGLKYVNKEYACGGRVLLIGKENEETKSVFSAVRRIYDVDQENRVMLIEDFDAAFRRLHGAANGDETVVVAILPLTLAIQHRNVLESVVHSNNDIPVILLDDIDASASDNGVLMDHFWDILPRSPDDVLVRSKLDLYLSKHASRARLLELRERVNFYTQECAKLQRLTRFIVEADERVRN